MPVRHTRRKIRNFEIHTLADGVVSISIAPELGGRIVSLRDRISGREWLDGWSPARRRRLWHPADPANFESGPGAGIDECLPTVLPCKVRRKSLPDHGELWNQQPDFAVDPKRGFACRWSLKSLPLDFQRLVSLRKHTIRFDYRITNRSNVATPFLWAWHPLFTWKPGDQIRTTQKTCLCPGGGKRLPWPGNDLSRAFFPQGSTPAAKVFLGPLSKGAAAIVAMNGSSLSLTWPTAFLPFAGIWITRGFWKGLHHWAIEPTNAPVDRLSDIRQPTPVSQLTRRESREWSITVKLKPGKS